MFERSSRRATRRPLGPAVLLAAFMLLLQAAAPAFHLASGHPDCCSAEGESGATAAAVPLGGRESLQSGASPCEHCAVMFKTWRTAPPEADAACRHVVAATALAAAPAPPLVLPDAVLSRPARGPPSLA
jgi:hypothetical protein